MTHRSAFTCRTTSRTLTGARWFSGLDARNNGKLCYAGLAQCGHAQNIPGQLCAEASAHVLGEPLS